MLLAKPPEELQARWDAMPDKIRVHKTLDLMEHGAGSAYVPVALSRLQRMCAEMEESIGGHDWPVMPADRFLHLGAHALQPRERHRHICGPGAVLHQVERLVYPDLVRHRVPARLQLLRRLRQQHPALIA